MVSERGQLRQLRADERQCHRGMPRGFTTRACEKGQNIEFSQSCVGGRCSLVGNSHGVLRFPRAIGKLLRELGFEDTLPFKAP